jgi:heat shock protein HslJ
MPRIRLLEIIGAIVIVSLTAFAGISCADEGNAEKLESATWALKSYGEPNDLKAAIPGHEPTLTFDNEKKEISGNGGVNGYGGNYEINGNKLTVSDVFRTMIASLDPALNEQETAYFNILVSAQSYKISGEELTITGSKGVLVFTQK